MGKHHHHPHEGHSAGNPPHSMRNHLHHNWFFYVSGIFILIGLLAFIVWGGFPGQFSAPAVPPKPLVGGAK